MTDRGCSYLRAHGEAETRSQPTNHDRPDKQAAGLLLLTSDLKDVRAADQPPIVHVAEPALHAGGKTTLGEVRFGAHARMPQAPPRSDTHARSGTCCSPCPPSDVAPGCAAAPDEHTAQAYQARLLLGLRGVTERAPLIPLRARRKEATPRCSGPCDHHSQGCGWPRPSSSTSSSGRNATRAHARSAQL